MWNFQASADSVGYADTDASGYADVNAEGYPEADTHLPEDVDDGDIEVTGEKEVLPRWRQKLFNEQIGLTIS